MPEEKTSLLLLNLQLLQVLCFGSEYFVWRHDTVLDQFRELLESAKVQSCFLNFDEVECRLWKLFFFGAMNRKHAELLSCYVKHVLLSRGTTNMESDFSIDNDMIDTNEHTDTIVALQPCKHSLKQCGGLLKFEVTKRVLCVRGSRTYLAYKTVESEKVSQKPWSDLFWCAGKSEKKEASEAQENWSCWKVKFNKTGSCVGYKHWMIKLNFVLLFFQIMSKMVMESRRDMSWRMPWRFFQSDRSHLIMFEIMASSCSKYHTTFELSVLCDQFFNNFFSKNL